MSFALVAKVSATPGSGGGTTGAIDTTGANLITICVAAFNNVSSIPTPTDSKSNTYVRRSTLPAELDIWECYNPTVGSGHTFTVAASALYPFIGVMAFSGADPGGEPFDQVNTGGNVSPTTSVTTSNITPTTSGQLLVTTVGAFSIDYGAPLSITGGGLTWNMELENIWIAGVNMGGGCGWAEQPSAAAVAPTWHWANNTQVSAEVVSFKGPFTPTMGSNSLYRAA